MADVTGTQTIIRTIHLLRLMASQSAAGARLTDLARATRLPAPTVRRMLRCLLQEGMASQDPTTRRYHLGPLVAELGLLTSHHQRRAALCQPMLDRLARETGDTVYLAIRSGFDAVSIARATTDGPVRITTTQVGDRLPLGVGPGGVVLLAALEHAEAEAAIATVEPALATFGGFGAAELRSEVAFARQRRFAISRERITPGLSGIGVAVPQIAGHPPMALTLGSISARIEGDRCEWLAALLHAAARDIAALLEGGDARAVPAVDCTQV